MSRAKLRVLEECSKCQMTECPAIVITQETQGNPSYCFYVQGKNDLSEFFYGTWNFLEVTILSSELSIFILYPKTITLNFTFVYGTMLGSQNSELSSFALHVY